jgi:hypothetical protein
LAAGTSIIPKTAARGRLRVGARHRGRLAGEGGRAAVEVALGEEQDAADAEGQHETPDEQARPVDGDRAPDREEAARGAVVVRLHVAGDQDDADQGDTEAGERQRDLADVAQRARDEGLHHDAEAGDAEDDQERPELEVLDAGLGELDHW